MANPDFVSRTFARRDVLLATGAAVLPFLTFAGYLAIAVPNYRQRDLSVDFIALLMASFIGAGCVAALSIRRLWRVVTIALYVPSMAGLLMIFALYFVCAAFGDCL